MAASPPRPEDWITVRPEGLYCVPGGFFVDPVRPVDRAVVTHGHSDHARSGHGCVLATAETLAIMAARYGAGFAGATQALAYGTKITLGGVRLRLVPAGHILGSAQAVLEHAGTRIVISGDYKRRRDPTCLPFQPVPCDVFVTEATFALPVFRHPDDRGEIVRLLDVHRRNPDRSVVVGVYALGKCQRVIRLLREVGHDGPVYLHGALAALCDLYAAHGIALGPLLPATDAGKAALAGALVLAPPAAVADRWARRLADPIVAMASGWMRVRQRARQRGVELPLVISDHADWDELLRTIDEVGAPRVWVTHGREEALVHAARARGVDARALAVVGFDEEES
ncbi:MAG: ligase-associated DNA damage response exonuclease [Alphaproteobacteria bacterium]|nr:ligase-associated DNA damage response exonuclease [Alphaproteobacteria bacterium]